MDCAAPLRLSGLIRDEAICDGVEVLFCFKATTSVIEEERNWAALTTRPSDGFLHRHSLESVIINNQGWIAFWRLVGI